MQAKVEAISEFSDLLFAFLFSDDFLPFDSHSQFRSRLSRMQKERSGFGMRTAATLFFVTTCIDIIEPNMNYSLFEPWRQLISRLSARNNGNPVCRALCQLHRVSVYKADAKNRGTEKL